MADEFLRPAQHGADGGAEARRIRKEFQPRLNKAQYLELMQRLTA